MKHKKSYPSPITRQNMYAITSQKEIKTYNQTQYRHNKFPKMTLHYKIFITYK